MRTCNKKVYRTMCETDNGNRHGKYGTTKYDSKKKYARKTTKKNTARRTH